METNSDPPYATYVTPVEDGPTLTRREAFYQRHSRRLKEEAKERRIRSRKKLETFPEAEQVEIRDRRRQSQAVYRERHRDELRAKERLRRQRRKASTGHSTRTRI